MTFPQSAEPPGLPSPVVGQQLLLYLHVPFCVALCPFCSFQRVPFRESLARSYFAHLQREIELVTEAGFRFDELYIGGGTPTVMPGELLETIRQVGKLHRVRQISVETNPDDLDTAPVRRLPEVGVQRLSVGVQSFDDTLLAQMQRLEPYGNSTEIRARLRRARDAFTTLNVDMIFNLPQQTEASLRRDLDILVDELSIGQISFYPLMAAPSTRKRMQPHMGELDYAREEDFYNLIVERMLAAGYRRSSAWCFDRDSAMSDEYIVERDEYLGLGSGAFSYLQGTLMASSFSIDHYRHRVRDGLSGAVSRRRLSPRDQMRYYLLMRLFGGELDITAAETRFRGTFASTLRPEIAALRALGAISRSAGKLSLTEAGYYLWVVLMREFFTGLNRLRDEVRRQLA